MDHLPLFLDIRGKKVVVDGATTAAARRIERARDAGANVWVFDPAPSDEIIQLSQDHNVTLVHRLVRADDFHDCIIAYGASEVPERDDHLYKLAKAAGALVNVADVKPLCDFITPSIVDRSPVTIAISTGGNAPVIARILRARIEALLPESYGGLATFLSGFRRKIEDALTSSRDRRRFWEKMIDGPIGDAFLAGRSDHATKLIDHALSDHEAEQGAIWLIGIGAGDTDLLTFRALNAMQQADVIVHNGDASDALMALTRRDADRLLADATTPEDAHAFVRHGKRVVWLAAGDPCSDPSQAGFLSSLAEFEGAFHAVPGVTHRGYSLKDHGKVVQLTNDTALHAMSLAPRTSL